MENNKNYDTKSSPNHVIIFERSAEDFCKQIDEAVQRGAEFLPETFQFVSVPGRAHNYVGMIRIPPEASGRDS